MKCPYLCSVKTIKNEQIMKTIIAATILAFQFSFALVAQTTTINLRVPNFARPLVEKWVSEYQKEHADVAFQFVSAKAETDENTLALSADEDALYVARYAVLPVTASGSEAERLLEGKHLNAKKLKKIFFASNDEDEEVRESKIERELHIYAGNGRQSVSRTYAAHFKADFEQFKGKKIAGDDSFLSKAIDRDTYGLTINSLSNLFDLQSRAVRNGLSLVQLDLDKQARQVLEAGKLDDIVTLLEKQEFAEIPVEEVGFTYSQNNPIATDFLRWVLNYGVSYNHEFGLLQLPQQELIAQQEKIDRQNLAQK